jgi:hypothetical protein
MSEKFLNPTRGGSGRQEPIEMSVDLKWSIWSKHADLWKDRAPETYKHMKAGVDGGELEESGDALLIRSSAAREIRYGSVYIYYNAKKDSCAAEVRFCTEWDDAHELADVLGKPVEDFEEMLPRHSEGIGCENTRTVYAKTLRTLLKKIDAVEDELLKDDAAAWTGIEEALKDRAS